MTRCEVRIAAILLATLWFVSLGSKSDAQPEPNIAPPKAAPKANDDGKKDENKQLLEIPGLTRLSKKDEVWIDPKQKIVVVDGRVVLRRGTLELLACQKGTKDYESVIALNSKSMMVHTALLAVGAKSGSPVHFDPDTGKITPAHGPIIDIWVLWKDKEGMNRKVRAQDWVRNIKTKKQMTQDWVFGGSHFVTNPDTGQQTYEADISGELICVSNFSTATMDLPVASSADAGDLLFEPFTERIPAKGTHVRVVLKPRLAAKAGDKKDDKGKNDS